MSKYGKHVKYLLTIKGQTLVSHGDSFYLIFDDLPREEWKTWSEARDVCRERGYDLLTINDEEEDSFIHENLP